MPIPSLPAAAPEVCGLVLLVLLVLVLVLAVVVVRVPWRQVGLVRARGVDLEVNTPANTPANTPVNTPVNTPANTPANAPANTPANTPASTAANAPANAPRDAPSEALADAQAELARAREAALAATRAKDLFLANMSHELRTPFDALIGLLQLLHQTPLDARQRTYVDKAEAAARSLLVLLGDLLDLSRIEAGRLELEATDFSLAGLIDEVLAVFDAAARGKGLDLRAEIQPALGDVWVGDRARLKQVLTNLVGNAVKFTPQGGVRVEVGAESPDAQSADGCVAIHFVVADTGIGIAPEQRALIFERFQQADSSMTRAFGGAGLGLAICKGLVDVMGGAIGVDSEPGAGSRFRVVVPLCAGRAPTPTRQLGAAPGFGPGVDGRAAAPSPLAGLRVLVVEDNEVNRFVAQEMLGKLGASVDTAVDGEAGVQRVLKAQPGYDLVLMDLQMPVLSGLDATRLLRVEPAFQDLPILAMSATLRAPEREACAAAGMNGVIPKPTDWPAAVRQILHLCGRTGPLPPQPPPLSLSPRPAAPPAAPGHRPLLDLRAALHRVDGSVPTYCGMARRFLAAEQERRQCLLASLEQGASDAAEQLHTLRGAALALGAEELADFARALEDALGVGLGSSLGGLAGQLDALWRDSVAALRHEVEELEAGQRSERGG
jgi:signal transduction histidine kinase/HPt (histidine-containing phosphotransfer) domain-containing protein